MNLLRSNKSKEPDNRLDLESLWNEARSFGKVAIHTHDDGTISSNIKFGTLSGVSLEAKSGFDHKDIKSSLLAVIDNAKLIRGQFK